MTALLLGYEDIEGARAFFVEALGFEEEWEVRDDSGGLTRAHVRFGDTVLMLDKPGAHNVLSPRAAGGVTHLIVINVGDVDAHHARAAGAGATVLVPPCDRPWGRDYEISDAEGYIFSFISQPACRAPPANGLEPRRLLAMHEQAERMAGGVEHPSDPRSVPIGGLVWRLGTSASKNLFDGSIQVLHENLEVHHLRLLPELLGATQEARTAPSAWKFARRLHLGSGPEPSLRRRDR